MMGIFSKLWGLCYNSQITLLFFFQFNKNTTVLPLQLLLMSNSNCPKSSTK